jgi:heme/copper-type cytochrome/quinol oxidase subunit 2
MTEKERVDQQQFDQAVNRNGKVVLEALAGLGVVAALIMSMIALIQSGEKHETAVATQPAKQAAASKPAASVPVATQVVNVSVIGAAKGGPDGKKHDIFTKTEFSVKVGQPLKLKIDNTDDVPHSITSSAAGVKIVAQPGVHTYTMLVSKAGKFQWYCLLPCDGDANGWAMQHPGYMSGYITAA